MVQQTEANIPWQNFSHRERELWYTIQCSACLFVRLLDGLASAPFLLDHGWDLASSRCMGAAKNKKELGGMLLLQRTHRRAEDTREYKRLSVPEEKTNQQIPLIWNLLTQIQSRHIHRKGLETLDSLARLTGRFFLVQSQFIKTGKVDGFFQMHKYGKIAQAKGQNKSSETKPKKWKYMNQRIRNNIYKYFQKVKASKMVEEASDLFSSHGSGINITQIIAFVRNPETNQEVPTLQASTKPIT